MTDERIQVKGAQGRCPFCHDEVPRDERVACVACLAAHHAGCWEEHGRCSSCGEAEALRREGAATPEPGAEPPVRVTPAPGQRYPWQVEDPHVDTGQPYSWQVENPNVERIDEPEAFTTMVFAAVGVALVGLLLGLLMLAASAG